MTLSKEYLNQPSKYNFVSLEIRLEKHSDNIYVWDHKKKQAYCVL